MMRLLRPLVFVALSLLVAAATAYAECAWIAWVSATHETGKTSIPPIGTSDSKADCEQRGAAVQKSSEARMPQNNLTAVSVICLPDTVDPRVPKEK